MRHKLVIIYISCTYIMATVIDNTLCFLSLFLSVTNKMLGMCLLWRWGFMFRVITGLCAYWVWTNVSLFLYMPAVSCCLQKFVVR